MKRAILLDATKTPYLDYVGDTTLGAGANLDAGTVLSNFRHDRAASSIPVNGGDPRGDILAASRPGFGPSNRREHRTCLSTSSSETFRTRAD